MSPVSPWPERLSRLADMTSRARVLSSASTSATGLELLEHAAAEETAAREIAIVRKAWFIRGSFRWRVRPPHTHLFFECAASPKKKAHRGIPGLTVPLELGNEIGIPTEWRAISYRRLRNPVLSSKTQCSVLSIWKLIARYSVGFAQCKPNERALFRSSPRPRRLTQ